MNFRNKMEKGILTKEILKAILAKAQKADKSLNKVIYSTFMILELALDYQQIDDKSVLLCYILERYANTTIRAFVKMGECFEESKLFFEQGAYSAYGVT